MTPTPEDAPVTVALLANALDALEGRLNMRFNAVEGGMHARFHELLSRLDTLYERLGPGRTAT
jgi:hypothetical protein